MFHHEAVKILKQRSYYSTKSYDAEPDGVLVEDAAAGAVAPAVPSLLAEGVFVSGEADSPPDPEPDEELLAA
jgi:hypothetical protein